ncbi:MAG: 50S ribosomal protein L4 [Bacteroidota bacterium]
MEVSVFDYTGKDTGKKIVLSDAIYGIDPNEHAVYLDVKQYLANQRQGTHKSKERAEVSFSTRKLKKQKGTGGARAGSRKSPLMKGGGRVFGPRPRDYRFKLNKKVKVLARKSVLTDKANNAAISVLADFNFDEPKTKSYIEFLKAFSLSDKKTLLILPETNINVYKSSRNLQRAKVTTASQLNTYELMHADRLLISEGALEKIENLLK